jgi:hypothetical protein
MTESLKESKRLTLQERGPVASEVKAYFPTTQQGACGEH